MILGSLKIMVLVLPVCWRTPFKSNHKSSLCGLATSSRVTNQGPMGPKVSKPLPLSQVGPRSNCHSRSLTSFTSR